MGDHIGPAVIAATTISGTMIMGLAPVFLLGFFRRAGALSFHLSLWTGFILGVLLAAAPGAFPAWIALGEGKYADDLGVNFFGLLLCCALFLLGGFISPARSRSHPDSHPDSHSRSRPVVSQ